MTLLDPDMPIALARCKQFYLILKTAGRVPRAMMAERMNCSYGTLQREYTMYLSKYPQIKYDKKSLDFIFDP